MFIILEWQLECWSCIDYRPGYDYPTGEVGEVLTEVDKNPDCMANETNHGKLVNCTGGTCYKDAGMFGTQDNKYLILPCYIFALI